MESNLGGTMNVLHAAKELPKIKRVVCTSSSEIYGTAQYAPIDEGHPLNPSSPYAASKVAADRTSQVKRLICDYSLAKKLFGWRPRVRFEEGIRRNVEWVLKNRF